MPKRAKATRGKGKAESNSASSDNGLKVKGLALKQLYNVYEDLSYSSTPHVSSSTTTNRKRPLNVHEVAAKKALDEALAAEKKAEQARARANELMNQSSSAAAASSKKRPLNRNKSDTTQQVVTKRKRFTWSEDLHRQFLATIFDIGLRQAKPKLLLDMLKPAEGLTTEHIKSHLQKYRKNSKKTRALFMAQFEIAHEQAVNNPETKALNPGFHAYPMPVGRFPLTMPATQKKSSGSGDRYQVVQTPYIAPSKEPETAPKREPRILYDENGRKVVLADSQQALYLEDPNKPNPRSSSPPQPKDLEEIPPQTFEWIKQMETQMEIHNQIQERHRLQQQQHYSGQVASADGNHVNGNTSNDGGAGSDHGCLFTPLLSGSSDDALQLCPLNLNQTVNPDEEDVLFDFLD